MRRNNLAIENDEHTAEANIPAKNVFYACPTCKGGLVVQGRALHCWICHRSYAVHRDIPNFIAEDLTQSRSWSLRHSGLFDWLAPVYETRLWYPVVMKLVGVQNVASLPELLKLVRDMVEPITGNILDVACGPGTFGRRVAGPSRAAYGIDISAGMLEQGRIYAQREHVTNMHFARARVESLPFADGTFQAAMCCGSLHLFADTVLALREIGRALKPGALLVGVTFTPSSAGMFRFRKVREYISRSYGTHLFGIEALGELLREAGFGSYRARAYGSGLIFSAYKNEADTAGGKTNPTEGANQ